MKRGRKRMEILDLLAKLDDGKPTVTMETLIPAREVARLLHCNVRLVKAYAGRGDLPAMRMGNRWMFLLSLLVEWRRKKLLENCSGQNLQI